MKSLEIKKITGTAFSSVSVKNMLIRECQENSIGFNTKVIFSEFLEIESEYRCFVYNSQIVGMRKYIGGIYDSIPDKTEEYLFKKLYKGIKYTPYSFYNRYCCFTGKTPVLIEMNDIWSTGLYGLSEKLFNIMFLSRHRQIISSKN